MSERDTRWTSRLGVVLAVSGSAVGLGNFLRFPGQVASHGGGAFLLPYFAALLLLGIPIGWAEWAMGRAGGRAGLHGAPAIYGLWAGARWGRYLGVLGVLIPLAVYFYYILIEAWCLAYMWAYATSGGVGVVPGAPIPDQVSAASAYFDTLTGARADGAALQGPLLPFFVVVTALNLWFLRRGLSKGIETLCNVAMPTMAVAGLVVLVRVLTLGTPDPSLPEQSVIYGLGYLWNPNLAALADPETWLAAAGQIFFSLAVGFGVIINYASYLGEDDDVVLSGLTAASTNEFFEVALGGLITVTAAVVFLGVGVTAEATGSSFQLGFKTLPVVFAHMPGGTPLAALWFFMLFLAAITSSLSMLQPTKAFFAESLALGDTAATGVVAGFALLGNGWVLWYSEGLVALDTIDFWVGTVGIFGLATMQVFLFAWGGDWSRHWASLTRGARLALPDSVGFVLRYVTPTYLVAVFSLFAWYNLPQHVQDIAASRTTQATLAMLACTTAALVATTAIGESRQRRQVVPADGDTP
jgi:SNF family Na+-dependent transporter